MAESISKINIKEASIIKIETLFHFQSNAITFCILAPSIQLRAKKAYSLITRRQIRIISIQAEILVKMESSSPLITF